MYKATSPDYIQGMNRYNDYIIIQIPHELKYQHA